MGRCCNPVSFLETIGCLEGLAEYAECQIEVRRGEDVESVGYSGLLALPKRLREHVELISLSLLANGKSVPHRALAMHVDDLRLHPCGYNLFCQEDGNTEDGITVECEDCTYVYHRMCVDANDSCGCRDVSRCFDSL